MKNDKKLKYWTLAASAIVICYLLVAQVRLIDAGTCSTNLGLFFIVALFVGLYSLHKISQNKKREMEHTSLLNKVVASVLGSAIVFFIFIIIALMLFGGEAPDFIQKYALPILLLGFVISFPVVSRFLR